MLWLLSYSYFLYGSFGVQFRGRFKPGRSKRDIPVGGVGIVTVLAWSDILALDLGFLKEVSIRGMQIEVADTQNKRRREDFM